MSESTRVKPRLDPYVFTKNRQKWSIEALRPYAGHWVAWSFDGTRIVASDPDLSRLKRKLEDMGVPTDEVNHECLPDADNFEIV